MQEAEAYKERVIATAQGDSDRFRKIVAEYTKAPAVTRERMYLETMQQVYSNVTKVMVDTRSGSNLLYLPLDKILQQTAPSGPSVPATVPDAPASTGTPVPADVRSRDGTRTRDREGR
jgi:membrane protease subunit HflK